MVTAVGYYIPLLPLETLLIWTLLMAVPVSLTLLKKHGSNSNKIFDLWAIIVVVLLVENFLTPLNLAFLSYFPLWLLIGSAAFYFTSKRLPPPSRDFYFKAALLNLGSVPAVFLVSGDVAALFAAAVQAGPVLYDWFTVHRK